MTNRLNAAYRKAIHDDVMRYRFTKEVEALIVKRAVVHTALFEHFIPKSARDLLDSLPDGTVPVAKSFTAQVGGGHYSYLTFNGGWIWKDPFPLIKDPETVLRHVPYNKYGHSLDTTVLGTLNGSHPLAEKFEEMRNELADLQQAYNRASGELTAQLKSAHSFKRLVEQWPEIETFAKSYWQKEQNRTLPVIQRDHLNELFYLPPPKETTNAPSAN